MNNHISEDPDYQLWVLLHQARDVLHKVRERDVARHGVTAVQSAVLFVISANGGKTTSFTISRWLLREPHTTSSILSRMEKQGLIKKIRNQGGGGELTVALTEKGIQAYNKTANIDLVREMLSNISEDEREQLRSTLKKLRDTGLTYLMTKGGILYP